jgi:hypothetical protein
MASSDEDEDTHFCLKCHSTIVGLENYVAHRKSKCGRREKSVDGREDGEAKEPSETLKADDFFSSLNLQSSSKPPATAQSTTPLKGIVTRSKTGSSKRKGGEAEGKDKRTQSGGKRAEGVLPEQGEERESEEEDWESEGEQATGGKWRVDEHSTGGKWKPGEQATGGKWKPGEQATGGKWKPGEQATGGKWKPGEQSTGGKWKPGEHSTGGKWRSIPSQEPPSSHTGGKWTPQTAPAQVTNLF